MEDEYLKESHCSIATPNGPKVCNKMYSSKAMPPKPCAWDVETSACIRNESLVCLACPTCGIIKGGIGKNGSDSTDTLSCCARGGTWYGKCGKNDEMEFTWTQGMSACLCKSIFLI